MESSNSFEKNPPRRTARASRLSVGASRERRLLRGVEVMTKVENFTRAFALSEESRDTRGLIPSGRSVYCFRSMSLLPGSLDVPS